MVGGGGGARTTSSAPLVPTATFQPSLLPAGHGQPEDMLCGEAITLEVSDSTWAMVVAARRTVLFVVVTRVDCLCTLAVYSIHTRIFVCFCQQAPTGHAVACSREHQLGRQHRMIDLDLGFGRIVISEKRCTDYVSDSGMKLMRSSTKRQCDRALS